MPGHSSALNGHATPDSLRRLAQQAKAIIIEIPWRFRDAALWFDTRKVSDSRNKYGAAFPIAMKLLAAWNDIRVPFDGLSSGELYARMTPSSAERLVLLTALLFEPEFDGSEVGLTPMVWQHHSPDGRALDSRWYFTSAIEPFADARDGPRWEWELLETALEFLIATIQGSPPISHVAAIKHPWQRMQYELELIASELRKGSTASLSLIAQRTAIAQRIFPSAPVDHLPAGSLDAGHVSIAHARRIATFLAAAARSARTGVVDSALASEGDALCYWIEGNLRPFYLREWVSLTDHGAMVGPGQRGLDHKVTPKRQRPCVLKAINAMERLASERDELVPEAGKSLSSLAYSWIAENCYKGKAPSKETFERYVREGWQSGPGRKPGERMMNTRSVIKAKDEPRRR